MKVSSAQTVIIRLLAAAVIAVAFAFVGVPSANAATVVFRGCSDINPGYSDLSSHRVCSWENDFVADGVRYHGYIDRYDTYSSYAGWGAQYGWRWTSQRTYVIWLANDGNWYFHSCVVRYPDGSARNC